jgi:hypothetical protein
MFARRSTPFVTTATGFPAPAPSVLFPNPLTTFIVPLSAGDLYRRELKSVFVTVFRDSVADDNAGITDCSRDRQNFELALGKITERVEIVHFVADIQKRVFGIIAGGGGADDHSGGVLAVAGNVVRGGRVTTERSEIGNRVSELALSL